MVSLAALGSAQSDPTKPVATVNGEEIGGMEYFRRLEFLPGVGRMIGDQFVESWPGYLALQQLINERLILQVAKERNVLPTDAQVKAEVEVRTKQSPNLLENLAKVGISRQDLEHQIRVDLAEFNIITQGITITDQELEKHYNDNPTRFTIPKRFVLRLIAVQDARRADVDRELAAGKSFEEVAKALSQDPSAQNGGLLGEVPVTTFSESVVRALDATRVGQSTDWIRGNTAFFKFFVVDVKPQERIPFDDNTKRQLRRSLMLDRGRVRNNIERIMADARRRARITVTQPGLSEMIQEWQKSPVGLGG